MRPLLAPAVPPPYPSKLQRFLRHARRLALLALGRVESWWTWLFPSRVAPTAAVSGLSPESGLPFPPPRSARPTPTRPELQMLERRYFPGQAPTMLAGSLVGGGIAFVDQALLGSSLDTGSDPANGSSAPLSRSGGDAVNLLLTTDLDGAAPEASGWLVTWMPAGPQAPQAETRSPEAGESPEADISSAPIGPPGSGTDLSAPWATALSDDPLADPLASAWPLDGSGRPTTPEVSPDPFAELPPPGGGGGDGGGAPGSGGLIPETPITTEAGSLAPLAPIPGPATPPPTPPTPTPATPANSAPAPTSSPTPPSDTTPPGSSGTPTTGDSGGSGSGGGGNGGGGGGAGPLVNTAATITIPPHLPLRFEANQGQKNSSVQFSSQSNGYNLFLTATEMVVSLNPPGGATLPLGPHAAPPPPSGNEQWVVRMALVGAKASAQLTGLGLTPELAHYLVGTNPAQWHTNIPVYSQVSYHGVYPGIDVLYYGNAQHQLEYDFTVNPGASPSTIQLAFSGAQALYVSDYGDLVAHTPFGDVIEHAPLAYQLVNGAPQAVFCRYVAPDPGHVSFQVGAYNPSLPLVIDPSLVYSDYFGGSASDQGNAIAIDSQGDAYVAGFTQSTDLPGGSGHLFGVTAAYDAFISKITSITYGAQSVLFTDYLSGASSTDSNDAYGVAVDNGTGNVYVTGSTNSTSFPTTPGAWQTNLAGSQNAFLTEIKSDGTALVYSTYLGGSGSDTGFGLALGSGGSVYLTGKTSSPNFPTQNAAQALYGGGVSNAFATDMILPTAGPGTATMVYSTYLGGNGTDGAYGIAVDGNSGNAFVTGSTNSPNFPITPNAFQTAKHGTGSNAFVTRIAPPPMGGGPASITYSSYLGGSGSSDRGNAIALGSSGNLYLTGSTNSLDFPTREAFQAAYNGQGANGSNAFVTELTLPPAGGSPTTLVYSTYLGGKGPDSGNDIAVDGAGDAYVVGQTASPNFPTVSPLASQQYGGNTNAFVTAVAVAPPTGSVPLLYSTYLGGSGSDFGYGIAADSAGDAYITGQTSSSNFPLVPPAPTNPIQNQLSSSGNDAFISELSATAHSGINLQLDNPVPVTEGKLTNINLASFTYGVGQPSDYSASINWGDGALSTLTYNNGITSDGGNCCLDVATSHAYGDDGTYVITVTVNGRGATAVGYDSILVLDVPLTGNGVTVTQTMDDLQNPMTLQEGMALSSFIYSPVWCDSQTHYTWVNDLVIATFTDANPGSNPTDFAAIIDWGDGHATAGQIGIQGSQYVVIAGDAFGSHQCPDYPVSNIYREAGEYPITVQIRDKGGSRFTVKSTAIVQPMTVKAGPTYPFGYVCGVPVSLPTYYVSSPHPDAPLAAFSFSAGMFDPPGEFAVNINWGDGSQSPGTVVVPRASTSPVGYWTGIHTMPYDATDLFLVAGTHTYTCGGTPGGSGKTITVTVTDLLDGGTISESMQESEGVSSPCGGGPPTASVNSYNNVTEGAAIPPQVGASLATVYWPFQDPPAVSVDWGDGTPQTNYTLGNGLVTLTANNYALEPGTLHNYEDGTYTIKVVEGVVGYTQGGDECIYGAGTATITEATVTDTSLTSPGPWLGQDPRALTTYSFNNQPLLRFYDSNPMATAAEFNPVTLTWDDYNGAVTTMVQGTVVPDPSGGFDVEYGGSFLWHTAGSERLLVSITDNLSGSSSAGPIGPATFFGTVQVDPTSGGMNQVNLTGKTIAVGRNADGAVPAADILLATFTDPTPETTSNYTASIDWGDNAVSAGQVTPGPNGSFDVFGSHPNPLSSPNPIFVPPPSSLDGQYAVKVTVSKDSSAAGQVISDVQVVRARVATLNGPVAAEFNNSYVNGNNVFNIGTDSPVAVTVNWGDQTPLSTYYSATTYTNNITGINSSHIYLQGGTLPYQVTYSDDVGQATTGGIHTGGSPAPNWVVAPAIAAPTLLYSSYNNMAVPGIHGTMNQPLGSIGTDGRPTGTVAVATFYDQDPATVPGSFTATIYWGDGTQSPGDIIGNPGNTFTVLGSHTYEEPGLMLIGVALQSTAGATTIIGGGTSATIAPDTAVHQRFPGTRLEVGSPDSADGGQVTLAPNTGAVQVFQPLDFRLSHDSSLDGFIDLDGNPLQGMITGDDRLLNPPPGASPGSRSYGALVYSSDTVSPRPIAEVDTFFPASAGVPTSLTADLTILGQHVTQSFSTTGHQAGDTYALALQAPLLVAPSGVYPWNVHVHATFATAPAQDLNFTGNALVVDNDTSPFGAGWSLYGVNELVLTPLGALMVYGSGAAPRLFATNCTNTGFVSPRDDFGTLNQTGTYTYAYTSKYGVVWSFDATNADRTGHTLGVLTAITDPHGLSITLMYDTNQQLHPKLKWLELPDGAYTTFSYGPSPVTITEPGNRTVTLQLDSNSSTQPQLTAITDVDGTGRSFLYDSGNSHRLTSLIWSPLTVTFTYDTGGSGAVTKVDDGQGTTWGLKPASLVGFGTPNLPNPPTAANANAVAAPVTNPRGYPSTYTLDFRGWATGLATPDGNSRYWARDPSDQVNVYLDPLQRATLYTYGDGVGDLVQINHPDFGIESYAYDALRRRTLYQDPNGNPTTYQNDLMGDLVTTIDAKSEPTVQHWDTSRALLTALTDARGDATTFAYFQAPSRWLQSRTDAQPATLTYYYDSNGYASVIRDTLGHLTTPVYDARGRLLQTTDAGGGITSQAYNAIGLVTLERDQLGRLTQTQYDGHGWPTTLVEALGMAGLQRTTTTLYDAAGNVLSVSRPQGYDLDTNGNPILNPVHVLTSYGYDLLNRPVTLIQDFGQSPPHYNYTSTTAYDAVGNVLSSTDARGAITSYGYDPVNRRTVAIQAYGVVGLQRTTTTIYDLAGNVLATIDPRGIATAYAYDLLNRQTAVSQAVGVPQQQRSTVTTYDPVGNVLSVSTPEASLGPTATQGYDLDANGLPTMALHVVTSYGYDLVNRRTATIEALGTSVKRTTLTGYDLAGNVTTVTTEQTYDGQLPAVLVLTAYGYDALNRQTAAVQDAGPLSDHHLNYTTTTVYDAVGNVLSRIDGRGTVSSFGYDALNRRTVAIADYGLVTLGHYNQTSTTLYDAADNVTATSDPRGTWTRTAYDDLNRPTTLVEAAGLSGVERTTTTAYDADNNVVAVSAPQQADVLNAQGTVINNPVHVLSTYAYDLLNRQTAATQAAGTAVQRTTATVYDLDNNVVLSIDPRNTVTSTAYDTLNRATLVTQAVGTPLARSTATAYDAADNVAMTVDALGLPTTFAYDQLNRRTLTIQRSTNSSSGVALTTTTYDAANNVLSVEDPLQNTSLYAYDALNRQTLGLDPKDQATETFFDPDNNVTQVIDADENPTAFQYDRLNRQTLSTDARGASTVMGYDLANNLTYVEDRDGRQKALSYDPLNRLVTQTWYDATDTPVDHLTYSYDAANNLLTAANTAGAYAMTYDPLNRVSSTTDLFGLIVTDSYDADNNRTAVADSLGGLTTSTYDVLNRLTSRQLTATGQAPMRTDEAYNARDELTSLTDYTDLAGHNAVVNGVWLYDSVERVTLIDYINRALQDIDRLSYGYDDDNRVTQLGRTAFGTGTDQQLGTINNTFSVIPSATIRYDQDSEVQSDVYTTLSYGYDPTGNRTGGGQVVQTGNELRNDSNTTYGYDAEGNQTLKRSLGSGPTWAYTYDVANRLVSATESGTTQNVTATFLYDVFGNRVAESVSTNAGPVTTTRFAMDGVNVWADLSVDATGGSHLQQRYLRGDQVDQLFGRQGTDENPLWYLADRQGSAIDLVNSQGQAMQRVLYGAYGALQTFVNPGTGGGDRYQYTGRELDGPTGLQYNRARWFDPQTGRWLTQDPAGLAAGDPNLYRYAGDDATNATDPSGLASSLWDYTGGLISDIWTLSAEDPSRLLEFAQAAQQGWQDGQVIVANTFTFGQIDALNREANRLVQQNGGLYVWSGVAATVAREALITAATLGVGRLVSCAGSVGLQALANLGPRGAQVAAGVAAGARLAQPVFAGYQVYQVGTGVGQAYDAFQAGDLPGAVTALSQVGFNSIGLTSSLRESARLFKAALGGSQGLGNYLFQLSCFAAGTPLLTPTGAKSIEQFRVGDLILSRSEFDPDGLLEAKRVEEVFVHTGRILHLHVGGQVIRTTPTHPVWVRGKGWVPAGGLQVGELLNGHNGQWVAVEDLFDTGEYETVYNLRIQDYHTYFVGGVDWGFSVWAHNACNRAISEPAEAKVLTELRAGKGPTGLTENFEVVGSISNTRGNGLDFVLRTESGKYVFVEVKGAAGYRSPGAGFNSFQRSFNKGSDYVEAQMTRIVDSYQNGGGQFSSMKTGAGYLSGQQAAAIHQEILMQGGYSNVDVYVARVNNVVSQQVPGTNSWQYISSDPTTWKPW